MLKTMEVKKPNFFIVGAAKSGTTALYTYLKQHPEIFMYDRKETRFFGSDLYERFPHFHLFHRPDLDEYLSYFKDVTFEKRIGEATPSYLVSERAAKEIKEFNSKAKIIIMLRNPVDLLYSVHSQHIYDGSENIYDFWKAINATMEERQKISRNKEKPFVDKYYYMELPKFYKQVKRYLDVFGKENVHIIIFDDFKNDTRKCYIETLKFLEVSLDFEPEFKIVNPNKVIRSKKLKSLLESPPYVVKLFVKIIPYNIRRELFNKLWDFSTSTKYKPRPPLDESIRKKLQFQFKEEIEKLSLLINRDLTHWCKM